MPQQTDQITIYIDGGSRGNPGPAAAAFIIKDKKGHQVQAKAFFLGHATNNVAEYTAIIKALEAARNLQPLEISVFSDSELLVRQLNGQYKVKSENIIPLFEQASYLLKEFPKYQIGHIVREKNKQADSLVNRSLDAKKNIETQTEPPVKTGPPIRLGVLISGGGTTLINILNHIKQGKLNAEIAVVICSRSDVAGVEKAKKAGLNLKIIQKKDYPESNRFSGRIEEELAAAKVDLVIQAGWLCLWKIPPRFLNRVMNIHPAILPSFGGKGMWGHHVHEAVLKAGCKISGCTVHFCTNEYDKGPVIIQRSCPVMEDDTPDTLAERVFVQECIAYPQAICLFADGKLVVKDAKVIVKS